MSGPLVTESSRVEDQTTEEWRSVATCFALQPVRHSMVSLKTGANGVRYVEQCEYCGWIDPRALDRAVEDSIKRWMTERAQRVAVSAESKPFSFVQTEGVELEMDEVILQALAAVHLQGVEQGLNGSDGQRLASILKATLAEMHRFIRLAKEER